MLRRCLKLAVVASLIAVVAGFGWIIYGEMNTSEAAHFDASLSVAHSQSENMRATLGDAGAFVEMEIGKITSIAMLRDEWTPRYQRAQSAYTKFDAAIIAAEERAEAYFAAQRALTEQYHNPERRAQIVADDEADYAIYREWLQQAHQAREHARLIANRLADMDTDLRKLELRSEFSFDASSFRATPAEILELDNELAQFQIASENIRQITASPFGAY